MFPGKQFQEEEKIESAYCREEKSIMSEDEDGIDSTYERLVKDTNIDDVYREEMFSKRRPKVTIKKRKPKNKTDQSDNGLF